MNDEDQKYEDAVRNLVSADLEFLINHFRDKYENPIVAEIMFAAAVTGAVERFPDIFDRLQLKPPPVRPQGTPAH